jgi:hypothetical protein
MVTVVAIIARCIEINRAFGLISIAVINDFLNVFDNFWDIFTNTGLDIRSTYLFFMCSITSFLIVSVKKKKKTYIQSFHVLEIFTFPISRQLTENLGVIDLTTLLIWHTHHFG